MLRKVRNATLVLGAAFVVCYSATIERLDPTWLWINPVDIESRDLVYGAGSPARAPKTTEFTFVEEDTGGVNPKYVVKDANGVEWKVKIGLEARPEIAAWRLVWAAGYHTYEGYFVPALRVSNMPEKVRGQSLIGPGGTMTDARLRRIFKNEKKVGFWNWDESPYLDTREFNGLRAMMALLNNWDIKDTNTAIVDNWKSTPARPVRMYMASDLGSSFGSTEMLWKQSDTKGNLELYTLSPFITSSTADQVSFSVPGDFRLNGTFVTYLFRRPRKWITRDIPRQDAKWLGELLSRLSPAQIRDAFKGAGYPTVEADLFARVVERRIAALKSL